MKRWISGLGLLFCLSAVQQGNAPDSTLSSPALWADLGLVGAVVFLVLLIIGPRGKRAADLQPEEEGGGGEADE